MDEKVCTACGEAKSLDCFYKRKDGRTLSNCKKCVNKKQAEYRAANKDKMKEKDRKYYQKNKARLDALNAQWAKDNPERSREIKRNWRDRNPEKVTEIEEARRDQKNEYYREWSKTERGKLLRKEAELRRVALKMSADCDVTASLLQKMQQETPLCVLCGIILVYGEGSHTDPDYANLDHIVPLATGGPHTSNNLRYICRSCNIKRPRDGRDLCEADRNKILGITGTEHGTET